MALQEAKKHWHCSESLGKPLNPYLLLFSVFRVSVEPKILTLFSDGVCRRRDESKAPSCKSELQALGMRPVEQGSG